MVDASTRLHNDYTMIMYPRKKWANPAERVFRVDKDNLVSPPSIAVSCANGFKNLIVVVLSFSKSCGERGKLLDSTSATHVWQQLQLLYLLQICVTLFMRHD